MNKMKDFRCMADEVMQDIHADSELKRKTMQRLERRRHVPMARYMVSAACVLLAIGIVTLPGLLKTKTPIEDQNPEMNIMMGQPEDAKALPGQEPTMIAGERKLESLEAAREDFGEGFLVPAELPQGFTLESIYAYGEKNEASQIILTYVSGEKSFLVMEEKIETREQFENARKVELRGETGYLNPGVAQGESEDKPLNELHWYVNKVHYTIGGLISQQETVEIALSMK